MAKLERLSKSKSVIELSRKEAADLCALLIGQLAGTSVAGSMDGACPSVVAYEDGLPSETVFCVEREEKS